MRLFRKRTYVKRWFLSYNYQEGNKIGYGCGEVLMSYPNKRKSEEITSYADIQTLANKIKEHYHFDNVIVLFYCTISQRYEYEKPKKVLV